MSVKVRYDKAVVDRDKSRPPSILVPLLLVAHIQMLFRKSAREFGDHDSWGRSAEISRL